MASLAPSSPRLPSPPPPAEIQIGPKPPSAGSPANRQAQQMEQTAIDANSKRRIHPGTRSADMAAGPPLVPLSELDSAFQLQEHLAALHYHHTATNTNPVNRETAAILATPPPGIDRTLWLYELCRFLIEQCNSLIVGFLFDTPPCSAATCPEMRASEWQFLCAVHDQPKACCAIDYCCHTLDWAANVVTNPQLFPSRFVALSDGHDKGAAVKNLVNVFRRLHRIFAHAWFQHRGVFWTVEGQTGLYVFFKTVSDMYDLLPSENYKLPPEAEGLEAPRAFPTSGGDLRQQHQQQHSGIVQATSIARPRSQGAPTDGDEDHLNALSSKTSTRRHIRSSPSTGSAVTTVIEADEDEGGSGDMASRFRDMRIADPAVPEEDLEDAAEVPVIVDHMTPVAAEGDRDAALATSQAAQSSVLAPESEETDSAAPPEERQPAPSDANALSSEPSHSAEVQVPAPSGIPEISDADIPVEMAGAEDTSKDGGSGSVGSYGTREAPSKGATGDAPINATGFAVPDLPATSIIDFGKAAEPATDAANQEDSENVATPMETAGTERQKAATIEEGGELQLAEDPTEPGEASEAK